MTMDDNENAEAGYVGGLEDVYFRLRSTYVVLEGVVWYDELPALIERLQQIYDERRSDA